MHKKIFVSIYTTIFNVSSYKWNCIDLILNQSHGNFEWLIIYDKEDDKKLFQKLCKFDKRVFYIKNRKKGRCPALNLAIQKCKSDFVFNQDFDDFPSIDRIEEQLKMLIYNEKMGAVGGWHIVNYCDANIIEEHFDENNLGLIRKKLLYSLPFAHTFCGFRKSALLKIGLYPEDSNQEDGIVWAKLISYGYKVGIVEKNIGTHFIYKNSTYGQISKQFIWEIKFIIEKLKIRSILRMNYFLNFIIIFRLIYRYLPERIKSFIRIKVHGYRKI